MFNSILLSATVIMVAVILDRCLGETKRFHPLAGFGYLAQRIETLFNTGFSGRWTGRLVGMAGWSLLVLPLPAVYWFINDWFIKDGNPLFWFADCFIVYLALGLQSLNQHALDIDRPLRKDDLGGARKAVSYIVSRNTASLSKEGIARATVESVLENGHDAVIATLFWYLVGGGPMVILHRLVNTLDAMWGYKNKRFNYFGWFAARADDVMGWPSAKITSLLYILTQVVQTRFNLFSRLKKAIFNARSQSKVYKSLNGGWVMSSGASMLGVSLGGVSEYEDSRIESPVLGEGRQVQVVDIQRSLRLLQQAVIGFIGILFLSGMMIEVVQRWF